MTLSTMFFLRPAKVAAKFDKFQTDFNFYLKQRMTLK